MKRVSTVLQGEAADCGAACLTMIANSVGHDVDINHVRTLTNTSQRGLTLEDICDAAKALDMNVRPVQVEVDDLSRLSLPALLHWEMDHFVVLSAVSKTSYSIVDPRFGRLSVSKEMLERKFTGIAAEFSRSATFKPRHARVHVPLSSIIVLDPPFKRSLLAMIGLSIITQLLAITSSLFVQVAVDDGTPGQSTELLLAAGLGFSLMVLSQAMLSKLRASLGILLVSRTSNQMTSGLFRKVIDRPLSFFLRRNVGDISSRFASLQSLQRAFSVTAITSLVDGAFTLLLMAVMWSYSGVLFAISLLATVATVIVRGAALPFLREALSKELVYLGREQANFIESLRGILTLKALAIEDQRFRNWSADLISTLAASAQAKNAEAAVGAVSAAIIGIETIAVAAVGVTQLDQDFTIGMLVAFIFFKTLFLSQVSSFVNGAMELWLARVHYFRVTELVAEPAESPGAHETHEAAVRPSAREQCRDVSIELEGVGFRYGDDLPWLFNGLNVAIAPGAMVAIKGRSGTGKSTLIKIMAGLAEPTIGAVRVGGLVPSTLPKNIRRSYFSAVLQEDVLFSGSIAENIASFAEQVDMEKVVDCAKLALIHDDVEAMPMQYSTLVGDMGSTLSGGQKQRVIIARALYREAKIMFLDEATSHLDVETEKVVHEALNSKTITRVVASHRPWMVEQADLVIDLDAATQDCAPVALLQRRHLVL